MGLAEMALNQVKGVIAKADANKNGVPDVVEHLEALEKVLLFAEQVFKRFESRDWVYILTQLNAHAGQKFSVAEIALAAEALAKAGPAAHALAAAAHGGAEALDPKAAKKK